MKPRTVWRSYPVVLYALLFGVILTSGPLMRGAVHGQDDGTPNPNLDALNQQIATAESRLAQAESQRLAAYADALLIRDQNAELASLLGVRALRTAYTVEADAALQNAVDALRTVRVFEFNGAAYGMDISPDGSRLVVGSSDGIVVEWDITTAEVVRTFPGHSQIVRDVDISPDGLRLVTSGDDGNARVWDRLTGETLHILEHRFRLTSARFSPDGRQIVTAGEGDTLQLWDAATGELIRRFDSQNTVNAVEFSPDGQFIATGDTGGALLLWDVASGELVRTFPMETVFNIVTIAFSPDGRQLLSGGPASAIRLWDVETGAFVRDYRGHRDWVTRLAFAAGGLYFWSTSQDGSVFRWNTSTGAIMDVYAAERWRTLALAISPDGETFAAGGDPVRLWSRDIRQPGRIFPGHRLPVYAGDFTPDGSTFITGGGDGRLRQWDVETGLLLRELDIEVVTIGSIDISPDGLSFLSVNEDAVRLWNTGTFELLRTFEGEDRSYSLRTASFSPDGQKILIGARTGELTLWNAVNGDRISTLPTHYTTDLVTAAFSPEGSTILTASEAGLLRLWDIASGSLLYEVDTQTQIMNAVLSPDNRTVALEAFDPFVSLWDITTGIEIARYEGQNGEVTAASFSSDGRLLVTGSRDGTVRAWSVANGEIVRVFPGHTDWVGSLRWSPDGHSILSMSSDTTARLWEREVEDFIAYACSRVFTDFTADERVTYAIDDNEPTCPQFAPEMIPVRTPIPGPTHNPDFASP